jgi:hypothetical protein
MISGAALRITGFEWGIPQAPYWRNHYQDEAFVLGLMFKMGPDNLNPHYFINPTFHYYTLLGAVKAATLTGYIKPFSLPVTTNNFGQPTLDVSLEDYGRMYRVGRILSILESILLILLVFGIGRNLYGPVAGLIAAALVAVLPTFCYQSRFLVVDAAAVFWFVLTFWFITTQPEPGRLRRWSVLSGLFIGLAVGAKYTNLLIVLPFLYRYCQVREGEEPFWKKILSRDMLYAGLVAAMFFLFTTPYALLSTGEFLHGDKNGFGGIFGSRGLMYYNNYPANLLTPFTVATLQSLRLPMALLCLLGITWRSIRRRAADIIMLCFIVPFYVLLIIKASPHLRHVMPVLPFIVLLSAAALADPPGFMKRPLIRYPAWLLAAAVFMYTALFSMAYVGRLTPVDTRIASADWVKSNLPAEATIGLATYFPWNYTPPVEAVHDREKIMITGYDYDNLLQQKPAYFIITEYEFREYAYSRGSRYQARQFVDRLFQERDYILVKEFNRDFSALGVRFHPFFPNLDWNPVNPRIRIYHRRS